MTAEDELALIECCTLLGEDYHTLTLTPIAEENLLDYWRSIQPTLGQMRKLIELHRTAREDD